MTPAPGTGDAAAASGPTPIPLTVLTGFLGAGKTTLLNRILNGRHGLSVGVLVNDFGSVNIDAELVVGVEGNVVSLANGCVCCTIRDDLAAAVMATIARPERPEYLLLEASGVADPAGIAATFNDGAMRERIRLDAILCVVDAEQVFAAPETMELKLFQMACADMMLLNKVDLVDADRIATIRAWLDSRFHRYRLIEASHGNVPLEILLSGGGVGASSAATAASHALADPVHGDAEDDAHSSAFDTWTYESAEPLSLDALRAAVAKLPSGIYRAKGIVYASDAPQRRAVLQVVGRRADVALADDWDERVPQTRIVAIGAPGAIASETLRDAFDACIVRPLGHACEDLGAAPAKDAPRGLTAPTVY